MALREENLDGASGGGKPAITDAQAEDAFRTILKWVGEDANRDGLIETPNRMVRAYREDFAGYDEDPHPIPMLPRPVTASSSANVLAGQPSLAVHFPGGGRTGHRGGAP